MLEHILERLSKLIDINEHHEDPHPDTYEKELERQCRVLISPAYFLTIITWLPYIPLDHLLYPDLPVLVYLRLGLTVVGLLSFVLHRFTFLKNRAYGLFLLVGSYLSISTGLILGLVAADPIYMGGFALVIFCFLVMPLKPSHVLITLAISLIIFFITGISCGMTFNQGGQQYGLLNLLVAVFVSGGGIHIFNNIRKRSYEKSILIQTTNNKLAETSRELAKINQELFKANEIKNDLMGVAAHDLKDPLQIIILYTHMLQERLKEDPVASDKLEKIYHSSEKMIKLISGLLEIASIESGKLVLKLGEVNADNLAESVVKSMRPLAENKKQPLSLTAESHCTITGDKMLLQQSLKNLVGNAIKFSPLGKSIEVSVRRADKPGGGVIFLVRDEGPGLSGEEQKKLFQKFQRLSTRPTGGEYSTGLGLAITRDLVELHGGTIRAESQVGKGCTFIIEIPPSPPSQ